MIQAHVLVHLPCYDFTLLTEHTLDTLLSFELEYVSSGTSSSGGVTGGVYKGWERIHRGVADPRLLAIPRSRSRVADSDPNWDSF